MPCVPFQAETLGIPASPDDLFVDGCACDVSDAASVEALATRAQHSLGAVDLWINDAGYPGTRGFGAAERSVFALATGRSVSPRENPREDDCSYWTRQGIFIRFYDQFI